MHELPWGRSLLCVALQAGRLLANLIVAGGGVLLRAAAQAYRQAIVSKLPVLAEIQFACSYAVPRQALLACFCLAFPAQELVCVVLK